MEEQLRLKAQQLQLLEQKLILKKGLPFKYGLDFYPWQIAYQEAKFFKKRITCAANQIGKSTTQIDDEIDIATDPSLWPKLWPARFEVNPDTKPYSWYLYPNQDTVLSEFENKWEPYCLPAGEFKEHERYGWKVSKANKVLKYIEFNTGYRIYFKTYNQDVKDLQSGTVFRINCDEELPEHLLPELEARLFATDGQFSMVFTATLGQELWRRALEEVGSPEEFWPDAFKQQISMYDCLKYANGKPSVWTTERIKRIEANCKSKNEVLRRVYGRFVRDEGLKYPGFDRDRNYKPFPKGPDGRYFKGVPKGWSVYSAVDLGSGGKSGHPSGYVFLSVSPDQTKLRIFRLRRLDLIETTAGDTYLYYKKSRGTLTPVVQSYDFASADFGNIVARAGESWVKAKKDHLLGEQALNTAFKTGMLVIYYDPDDPEDESIKLVRELETLGENTSKKVAKDDLIDPARYAIVEVPINWEAILNGETNIVAPVKKTDVEMKRPNDFWRDKKEMRDEEDETEQEISEWSELY